MDYPKLELDWNATVIVILIATLTANMCECLLCTRNYSKHFIYTHLLLKIGYEVDTIIFI